MYLSMIKSDLMSLDSEGGFIIVYLILLQMFVSMVGMCLQKGICMMNGKKK